MVVFFFKQKTAYDRRISDWSSDVLLFRSGGGRRESKVNVEVEARVADRYVDTRLAEDITLRHAGICGRLREHAQPFEIHIVVAENSVDGHTGLRAADEPSEANVPVQTTSLRNGLAVRRKGPRQTGCGPHRSRQIDAVADDEQGTAREPDVERGGQ